MLSTNIDNEPPVQEELFTVTCIEDARLAREGQRGLCKWERCERKEEKVVVGNIGQHVHKVHGLKKDRPAAKDTEKCPYCSNLHSKRNQYRCRPKIGSQAEQFQVDSQPSDATRPQDTLLEDGEFIQNVLQDLKSKSGDGEEALTHGESIARNIHPHLVDASPPILDGNQGEIEAHFCTSDEDCKKTSTNSKVPVIAFDQQPYEWSPGKPPIQQFMKQWRDELDLVISVQIPSRSKSQVSYEERKLKELFQRFEADGTSDDPWNGLDIRCRAPNVHPKFLEHDDCQFLHHIHDGSLKIKSGQRDAASTVEVWQHKIIEKGSLLTQGGSHTDFHIDSYGWGTWITVQQGKFGFLWMANFTKDERAAWKTDRTYNNGKVRYVVLRPKQTIFFPPGTIHAVVRLEDTFSITGHLLRWFDIKIWLEILEEERDDSDITNEYMSDDSILRLLEGALIRIRSRIKRQDTEAMGGSEEAKDMVKTIEVSLHSYMVMGVTKQDAEIEKRDKETQKWREAKETVDMKETRRLGKKDDLL
jgi:hypothetical protein